MSAEQPTHGGQGRGGALRGRGQPGLLFSLLLLSGCGYLGGGSLAFDLERIALTAQDEVTARADLRPALLAALASRFAEDGRIRLVEPGQAQAILESRVASLTSEAVAFDQGDIARRFRVVLTLDVTLRGRSGNGTLLKETVRGEAYYSAPVGITGTRAAEEEGVRRAVGEAATRAALLLLEGF
ncbi:MAG: LPS assembly lipoprotein LptE [candidate division NC10 bacterium]|nr:LPS assembly lipoprotein LptE [candidate division NC10 bacterium]